MKQVKRPDPLQRAVSGWNMCFRMHSRQDAGILERHGRIGPYPSSPIFAVDLPDSINSRALERHCFFYNTEIRSLGFRGLTQHIVSEPQHKPGNAQQGQQDQLCVYFEFGCVLCGVITTTTTTLTTTSILVLISLQQQQQEQGKSSSSKS
ncbi:uncharacterized protein Ecym_7433 [Eremothecium cymbalariae DBVPG|uniref:Uncharacterized protein n=1 Tax=Eremothecium cymbalariae (strain CBS 270.75 / DBVPG 7215 / KCTC 17166 / NRRL Y-17582) TaxID=931890 RepID=G8JWN9_ERECY|nr:hypothetical protein Ecym_7433 [Eremothecium cymbalariae DBVPG\